MTNIPVEDKIALTGGADMWYTNAVPEAGLPQIMLTDGPHGVRKRADDSDHIGIDKSVPATCFPPAVGLSSTWNPDLVEEMGVALGEECRALKVGVLLGPALNIKRSPLCGRNFEYFSEDPLVSGEMATALVKGVQSQGIGTSVKHFAVNNQETDRMRRDSQVDERTLREIYLRGFGKVIREAKPWTVMCSYNKLNGTYASENPFLLTQILRDEWGFDGFVMSDWGAVQDRVRALKAGLDLEMPAQTAHEKGVHAALAAGQIDEAVIDQAYARIEKVLRKVLAEGLTDAPDSFDVDAHHALARKVAEQCIVLLANDGILPLDRDAKIAVIGEFARTPRYQGAGSSRVQPTRLDNALDAITALVGHDVPFAPGFATSSEQFLEDDARQHAVDIAKDADIVLAFLGLGEDHESEGFDRDTCDLPTEQVELLDDVLSVNPNVVVILSNGSSVLLPFADRVRAIVEGWLLGQAGGPAMADVLFGLVNPSGKITETIPLRMQDVPSYLFFPGDTSGVRYGEGLFVGYRGYDARQTEVAFPFGHGLSYTHFSYSDLHVIPGHEELHVSLTVTNTGDRAGREVVQVYISVPGSKVVRVPRELKGFASISLEPGASGQVEIVIPYEDLAYWSVADHGWVTESGEYIVSAGASSRDLRLSASVAVVGNEPVRPITMQSTFGEAMQIPAFAQVAQQMLVQALGDMPTDGVMRMFMDNPLASLAGFVGQDDMMQQLLDQVNLSMGQGE